MPPNNKMDDQRSAFNSTAPNTHNISVAACSDFIILKHFFFFSHSRIKKKRIAMASALADMVWRMLWILRRELTNTQQTAVDC